MEQQSISRTSDTMPFLFFSQFAPRKTFLWKTGKKIAFFFFFFMLNLAVSLIILSICSSIVVYSNMKTVEQICNPYYLQCFCASRGGGGRGEEIALQYCI